MEQLIDKLIAEMREISEIPAEEGGISDIFTVESIYFGDPGIIPVSLYPSVTVEPDDDEDKTQTTGYDTLELRVFISLHIDARAYFDSPPEEALGDRMLVQSAGQVRRWFQRRAKRQLDGEVLNVTVPRTEYRRFTRGDVPVKTATLTLVVRKNYQRVL